MKDVQGMSDIVKRSREYTIEAIQGLPLDEHSAEKIKKLMEAQNKKIEDVQQRYY
jgi:hypothetical protein